MSLRRIKFEDFFLNLKRAHTALAMDYKWRAVALNDWFHGIVEFWRRTLKAKKMKKKIAFLWPIVSIFSSLLSFPWLRWCEGRDRVTGMSPQSEPEPLFKNSLMENSLCGSGNSLCSRSPMRNKRCAMLLNLHDHVCSNAIFLCPNRLLTQPIRNWTTAHAAMCRTLVSSSDGGGGCSSFPDVNDKTRPGTLWSWLVIELKFAYIAR